MPARCHEDTCSIKWEEVNTLSGPAYSAQVDLAAAWMECIDGDGIRPKISPNAGNIIGNPGNGLFASLPAATVVDLSGNPDNKGVGQDASTDANFATAQSSDTYSWTNGTGRDSLLLVSGEFNFEYGILGPQHPFPGYSVGNGERAGRLADAAYNPLGVGAPTNQLSPYNAQIAMRLVADIGAPPTTSRKATRVDIGGMISVSNPASAERKVTRVPFFWMVRVLNGQTLNMKSQCGYQGPSQTVNVIGFNAGAGLVGTGHELWNLQVAAVPI